jgi:hypothetical protein
MGKLKGPEAIPGSLAFLSEGNYLVPLDFWYRSLWNLDTGAIVDQQKLKRKYNRAFVVAPHEMVIAAAQSDGHIAVAELLTSRPICLLVGPNATVRQVVFGSHGKLIASLDQEDNTVRLWSWLVSSADAKKRSLHALWKDLKSDDLKVAYEAVAELTARGPAAVEFLKGRLKPVTADNEYAAAVKQLDAAESGTRNKAHERLKHAGRDAETWLREGLNKEISVEAKLRIERLLAEIPFTYANGDRLRAFRAMQVLEYIGTPEAAEVLGALGKGTPAANETKKARTAAQRLHAVKPR